MKTALRVAAASLLLTGAVLATRGVAHAQPPPARPSAAPTEPKSWDDRYDEAYTTLFEGHLREAASLFHALARSARTDEERSLAHEMGRLASERADVAERAAAAGTKAKRVRTSDELTLLYASGFLYGAGTGVWFLLATEPDSAVTATLPFAALTAAPAIAIASVDALRPLPRGVPHGISAGLYIGLGESIWLVGLQQARAARFRSTDPASEARFRPETVTGILWTGATLGGLLGGSLAVGLETTPGRVSFTASTTLWAGVLSGLTAGALLPDDDRRSERAFAIGGLGYNAGLAGGLGFAGRVSPSVSRVRLADLFAIAGGLVTSGAYLSLARDVDVRAAEGLAAGGIATGLALGWVATSNMAPDRGGDAPRATTRIHPSIVPVPAGAGVGVFGIF